MKVSYNWLKQYLDFELGPEEVATLLTDCGLEVESVEAWSPVKGGLEGLVIGEVLECNKMPKTDHLSVTKVNLGTDTPAQIICGAPNVAAGQKVVVATPGTILYQGDQTFEIKKRSIRGINSEGMICAEDEIGLGTSHEGIMVLPPEAVPGTPAKDYFGLETDTVYEIGLTPNRTDAMSVIGVARDIKASINTFRHINTPASDGITLSLPDVNGFEQDDDSLDIGVRVEDPAACPRYTGVTLSGITVRESPAYIQNRLMAAGLRPINNVVDITNYVMLETGQPLHAFDADHVQGRQIVVRKLPKGSKFVTLDDVERELTGDDLMICNTSEGMCIGGVFGGLRSGVSGTTTSIFLESALFDPATIRKTSKHHGLQTDASFRFERGVDPGMVIYALKRASLLIKEHAGARISSEIKDVYPAPVPRKEIGLSYHHIDRLIGKKLDRELIRLILMELDFDILARDDDGFRVSAPLCRTDVTREADVIEEILRIYGYNNVEIPSAVHASVSPSAKPDVESLVARISDHLSGLGFREMMNNSLVRSAWEEKHGTSKPGTTVRILNPLSRELGMLRQSLLFGGLETLLYNFNRKSFDLKLYEFGKTYDRIPGKENEKEITLRYDEQVHLAVFLTGRRFAEGWNSTRVMLDFFDLKSILASLLKMIRLSLDELVTTDTAHPHFAYGMSWKENGRVLIEAGKVDGQLLAAFDIRQDVYYADIRWDLLAGMVSEGGLFYRELPKFPEVRRDLALLLDKNVRFSEIEQAALTVDSKTLRSINLFDVYEGENIAAGKKSYAVSFAFRDDLKTLTDTEVDGLMNRLVEALQTRLKAQIR
jgi:phenylalanyl-tRNA synthetase beta chain